MILIEEDDEKVGEESCSETAYKENKNTTNKTLGTKDNLQKPRAL